MVKVGNAKVNIFIFFNTVQKSHHDADIYHILVSCLVHIFAYFQEYTVSVFLPLPSLSKWRAFFPRIVLYEYLSTAYYCYLTL
jgi:hypothetical protein